MTGEIPAELGNLSNLQELALGGNHLTGEIPAELGNLSNLQILRLQENQLTGEIPAELSNLSDLHWLSLYNNQLTGAIPVELGDLSNLQILYLNQNQLTGDIPPELGGLANLYELYLADNQLTGAIPPELGGLANLYALYLADNPLTGCIPVELQSVGWNDFYRSGLPFCEVRSTADPSVSTETTDAFLVRVNSPITVTATFSEPIFGFTVEDISVANGAASNFEGRDGDTVYTFDVTPNAIGPVTVDIAAGVAQDADSNDNTEAVQLSLGIPYDDDHDGMIARSEVIAAIIDYFNNNVSREQVIALIVLYFAS